MAFSQKMSGGSNFIIKGACEVVTGTCGEFG